MCAVDVDDGLGATANISFSVGKKCMKCERPAVTTARTKDPFCKDCFNAYFVHRFRATFGKVRLFTTGERVLLAFSGGKSSRVLLGLAEEGLRLSAYKKLRFEPTVVVIDEGAVVGEEWCERCRHLSQCLAIATATGFHTVYTHIEQVFGECSVYHVDQLLKCETKGEDSGAEKMGNERLIQGKDDEDARVSRDYAESRGDDGCSQRSDGALQEDVLYQALLREKTDECLQKKVRSLFDTCGSVTAQEHMLLSLRHQLLVEVSRKLGYCKVLMGENATRMAVRLLGNVAQGRGRILPLDTGFIDDRATDVALIRPLRFDFREFSANEVAMYATLNGLDSVTIRHLTTLKSEQASIETLTEAFVAGLQVDFPSTVSTVFRTGDKLMVGGDEKLKKHCCALCQAPTGLPADPSVFTHLSLADGCDPDLWTHLCYGCKLTVKDMKYDSSSLPPFVDHTSNT